MRNRDDGRGDDLQEGFSKSRSISGKAIGFIVLAVILLILILQNSEKRSVQILFWDVTWPVWLTLTVVAALGFGAGYLIGRIDFRKKSKG
jgi:uncharacterized integral membrane protein